MFQNRDIGFDHGGGSNAVQWPHGGGSNAIRWPITGKEQGPRGLLGLSNRSNTNPWQNNDVDRLQNATSSYMLSGMPEWMQKTAAIGEHTGDMRSGLGQMALWDLIGNKGKNIKAFGRDALGAMAADKGSDMFGYLMGKSGTKDLRGMFNPHYR